ncbi:O-antigen ligase family protein [Patescibacteria group bacterium]
MSSTKLQSIIKYFLYALALTPLIITPFTIFPFIFGRGLIIQLLIEVIFGFYVILAISNKQYRPRINTMTALLGIFLIVLFFSSILGTDFNRSFWGNESRFTGWFFLLHLFLFFIVISSIFRSKKDWNNFLGFNVWVAIVMFGIAILSLFGVEFWGVDLGTRISGTLGNPIFLATYFILNLIFALYLFLNAKHIKTKAVWLLFSIIIFIGIILTQSNGALLGLGSGAMVGLVSYGLLINRKKVRSAILGFIILIIILIGALFIFKESEFVRENKVLGRVADISISSGTGNTRLMGWRVALDGIAEHPFLGWGVEGFQTVFNKYYNPQFLKYSYYETWFDKPHNKVLEVIIDSGFIGFAIYMSVFASGICLIYRKRKRGDLSLGTVSVLFGGLIAYFVQNLFIFDTPVSYLFFFVLLGLIISDKGNNSEFTNRKIPFLYGFFILLIILPIIWLVNISPLYASIKLRQNTTLFDAGQKINIGGYKQAMDRFNPYKEEWRVDLAKAVILSYRNKSFIYNSGEADYALEELKKNVAEHPNNAYYHMILGGFYAERLIEDSKYLDLAKTELDRALELSPERQHIYFVYGRLYSLIGDEKNLINIFNKVINLEPSAPLSYWEAGRHLYQLDPESLLVKKWLIRVAELRYVPGDKNEFLFLFQHTYSYLLENKKYQILADFYQAMQRIEPNEAKWYAQEATARYFFGDTKSALKQIKKAIEKDENYRIEGEEFIKLIEEETDK